MGSNPTAAKMCFVWIECCKEIFCYQNIYKLKQETRKFIHLIQGSVAERSKALVLGTSHFDGVGSNPTAAKMFYFLFGLNVVNKYFLFKH